MATKIYVLKQHTEGTAPIYANIGGNRVRLNKRPIEHAYTQLTFFDKKTEQNKTIRLKLNTNTIWLDEQVKQGMPGHITYKDGSFGNVPPTQAERDAVMFKNGVLKTSNPIVQQYLEASPQFHGFDGLCDKIRQPLYELLDLEKEMDDDISLFDKQVEAAVKIKGIETLEEAQELMYHLNGFWFKAPETLKECKKGLIQFLDDADDIALDKLLENTKTKDDEVKILIGRAMARGIISFTANPNQVSLKKGSGWADVRMISSDTPKDERTRLFAEYLLSKDGAALHDDIKNKVGGDDQSARDRKKQKAETV